MTDFNSDPVVDAINALAEGIETDVRHDLLAAQYARRIRDLRRDGLTYREITSRGELTRLLEPINSNLQLLHTLGHSLRVAVTKALRDEGLTVTAIAAQLGVSRQRVSELLQG